MGDGTKGDFFRQLREADPLEALGDFEHRSTSRIIDYLMDILDGLRGDKLIERGEIDEGLFTGVNIEYREDKQELIGLLEQLLYTANELIKFIETESRQVLLKYFKEEFLEGDVFKESTLELNKVVNYIDLIIQALRDSRPLNAGWIYFIIKSFNFSIGNFDENIIGNRSIIHAIIDDNDHLEKFEPVKEKVIRIAQDLGNLHSYLFSQIVLDNKTEQTVGKELYNQLISCFSDLKQMLDYLRNLTIADLAFTQKEQGKIKELLEKVKIFILRIESDISFLENPDNKEKIVNGTRKEILRDFMINTNTSLGLGKVVFNLVLPDSEEQF